MRRVRFGLAVISAFTITALGSVTAQELPAVAPARPGIDNYCECYSELPPVCEIFRDYEAVFIAKFPDDLRWFVTPGPVKVQVERAWKGIEPGETTLMRGGSGISCGGPFFPRRRYLILAHRDVSGGIEVSDCASRNLPLGTPEADEAIAWLDAPESARTGGRIFGDVRMHHRLFEQYRDHELRAVEAASVQLGGSGVKRNATVVNGRYEFTKLPVGSYTVSVTMPDGLPSAASARVPQGARSDVRFEDGYEPAQIRAITLSNSHACSYAPFVAEYDGSISGTVLNADGSPAAEVYVEALPETIDPHKQRFSSAEARTDSAGRYRIGGLMPGRYIAGVNLRDVATDDVPYPAVEHRSAATGAREVVTVTANGAVTLAPLRLPKPAALRRIRGTLAMADGGPIHKDVDIEVREAGRVYYSANQHSNSPHATTAITSVWFELDTDTGTFSGTGFEGRTYIIRAYRDDPRGSDAQGRDYPPVESVEVTVTVRGDIDSLPLLMNRATPAVP
jgi:hypothetical protein